MREIKFRYRIRMPDKSIATRILPINELRGGNLIAFLDADILSCDEYTGLHDKNGKEFYEGDKLQFNAEDEDNIWIEIVKWSDEMLCWCLYDDKEDNSPIEPLSDQIGADFEVIGNIYETPELIKETK